MKNIFLLALIIFSGQVFAQTSLSGKVTDDDGYGAVLANVALYKGTDLVTAVQTDFDGFYNFSNLDPGTYAIEVSYVGYATIRVTGVAVYAKKVNKLDLKLEGNNHFSGCGRVTTYTIPLVKVDQMTSGATFSGERLRNFYHGSLFTKNR